MPEPGSLHGDSQLIQTSGLDSPAKGSVIAVARHSNNFLQAPLTYIKSLGGPDDYSRDIGQTECPAWKIERWIAQYQWMLGQDARGWQIKEACVVARSAMAGLFFGWLHERTVARPTQRNLAQAGPCPSLHAPSVGASTGRLSSSAERVLPCPSRFSAPFTPPCSVSSSTKFTPPNMGSK